MAKPVVKKLTDGTLTLSVPNVEILEPPIVRNKLAYTLTEPPPPRPLEVPVIVPPRSASNNDPAESFFEQTLAQAAPGFYDLFFASVLQAHAYVRPQSDLFRSVVEGSLKLTPLTRLLVDQDAGRWIDTYETGDGRQIWVMPGTTNKRDWLAYANPGMRPLGTGINSILCYNGLHTHCDSYGSYVASNLAGRIELGKGAITLVGHSMGGTVAQYLAFVLNNMYKAAHPSGEDYPVGKVITFGAPAAFNAEALGRDFFRGYQLSAVRNPGDPIPYATIYGYKLATFAGEKLTSDPSLYTGPRHYITRTVPVSPGWTAKDQAELDARLSALDYRTGNAWTIISRAKLAEIERVKAGAYDEGSHDAMSYANRLERVCRANGDAPYPAFTYLVSLSRALPALIAAGV